MLCRNTGPDVARFKIDGMPGETQRYAVKPGEEVEIPDGYCTPYLSPTRKPMTPIVKQLHKDMEPQPGRYAPGMSPTSAQLEQLPAGAAQEMADLRGQVATLARLVETLSKREEERSEVGGRPPTPASPDFGWTAPTAPVATVAAHEEEAGDFDPDDAEIKALIDGQTKKELLSLAAEMGARCQESMTKAQLAQAILTKRAELDDDEGDDQGQG